MNLLTGQVVPKSPTISHEGYRCFSDIKYRLAPLFVRNERGERLFLTVLSSMDCKLTINDLFSSVRYRIYPAHEKAEKRNGFPLVAWK